MDYSLTAPSPAIYVTVLVGLMACLAIICTTMPLLGRLTGPETARNE